MTNPLLDFEGLPPFSSITAELVEPAIESLLEHNRRTLRKLLESGVRDWHGFARKLEELDDRLNSVVSPVRHLNDVMNSPAMRDAYEACVPRLSEYHTEMRQDAELFAAYKEIIASPEYKSLGTAAQKALDNIVRDFRLAGVDLNESQRERFANISKRLSQLGNKFDNNVLDATMAYSKAIADEQELAGLPPGAIALARQAARNKGLEGYLLTLDYPSYLPVMTYAENASLRREMYEAYVTRASGLGPNGGEFDNTEIIEEIMKLRQEQARLLGFRNFAEFSLATRMARSTTEVLSFLGELAEKAKPRAEAEFAEICEFARERFGAAGIEPWDVSFYAEKLKQDRFALSDEELRPYFPAPGVIKGMFEVVRRLYDIEIAEVTDMETWHEDVTTYAVYRQGEVISRFYLDPYARENKVGGAWMDDCQVRRVRLSGELQLPVAYLTCNFTPPVGGLPSLLTHDDVVTLFHEFGHGLHQMLTQVDCAPVSGICGVAWDAVELPSQFMENWCWEPESVSLISGHYETGEPLPTELLSRLIAARNFRSAMKTVGQLEFGLFDFSLHMEFEEGQPDQVQGVLDDVRERVAVVPAPGFNRFQHSFGHIFGGEYAAGYYSYKWAEVLSADAFAKFREDGIFNRQTGERFLAAVLEQGGSVDALDLFVSFRGREPDVEALLRQDGILG